MTSVDGLRQRQVDHAASACSRLFNLKLGDDAFELDEASFNPGEADQQFAAAIFDLPALLPLARNFRAKVVHDLGESLGESLLHEGALRLDGLLDPAVDLFPSPDLMTAFALPRLLGSFRVSALPARWLASIEASKDRPNRSGVARGVLEPSG
jgi:hypothetical protein